MPAAHLVEIFGWVLIVVAGIGALYTVAAAIVFARFFGADTPAIRRGDPVTLLKPLYGAEPKLLENLSSFLAIDHAGPIQYLFGVQRSDDPAMAVIETLRQRHPQARIDLVLDPTPHGANGKVGNLINMLPRALHPILVLSDSDIVVAPDYLARILAALDAPGIGAVTCAYVGRGDCGFWSRFGSAGIDWHMLPGVVFGTATGLAKPCMGSTIALRAETLAAIGGFRAFADTLADDYAIGQAVIALGSRVAVPPMLVVHAGTDDSLAALWRHELRWGATILGVEPIGYIAGVTAMPLPLALLATPLLPVAGAAALLSALVARLILAAVIARKTGSRPLPLAFVPLRDCFTFAGFVASFFTRSVDWRGDSLRMVQSGKVSADPKVIR